MNLQRTCTTGLSALAGKAAVTLPQKKGIHELLRTLRTQMWLRLSVIIAHLQRLWQFFFQGDLGKGPREALQREKCSPSPLPLR